MAQSKIISRPLCTSSLPSQSLGVTFFNELKKKNPSKTVLIDPKVNKEITYGSLLNYSVNLAINFQKLGIKKNDVITIVAENSWKYLIIIIASLYIGATVNVLNPDYKPDELNRLLKINSPFIIFCSKTSEDNVLTAKNDANLTPIVVNVDYDDFNSTNNWFIDKTNENNDFVPLDIEPNEVAIVFTSSGTTGFPKAVMITHANLRCAFINIKDPSIVGFNENDHVLAYLPMFHIFGTLVSLTSILFASKTIVLTRFIPEIFLNTISTYKITKLFAVPPILLFLVKSPLVAKYDVSSIKDVYCGAASISETLQESVKELLSISSVRQFYGLTETTGLVTSLSVNGMKSGTAGTVVNGYQLKICSTTTGEALGPNVQGEICIKGDGVMKGYSGNEEQTKASFDNDGFLKSGDIGYYDNEGFVYITDRLKEIIKYKGFQVSPAELESILIGHPAIKDAGVIGIQDSRAGEVPLAFVVKNPDLEISEEEIKSYIEDKVSSQKRLYGGVRFIQEIPRNPSGKIMRRVLKELINSTNIK